MAVLVKNNAYSTLASGISDVATSITLATGTGTRFPSIGGSDYFYATLIDTSNNLEVVKVTARSTDALTVTRAQDGTTARAYSTGDRIEMRVCAALIADIRDTIAPGDDTVTTAKIVDDAVTYAKMQNVSATSRVLGRKTVGVGNVEEMTLSDLLDFIGSAAQGDILYRGASSWARLAAGEAAQFLKTGGSGANPAWAYNSGVPDVVIEDQKNGSGGTNIAGVNTRVLNTLVRNYNTLAALSSNQFTLPAGTYYIEWSAPQYGVGNGQAYLYNVTSAATVARGQSLASDGSDPTTTFSAGNTVITIAASTIFEIRHYTETSVANGLGARSNNGGDVYTRVKIWRTTP